MKILLIGTKGYFDVNNLHLGTGIARYSIKLYEMLKKYVNVEKYSPYEFSSLLSYIIPNFRNYRKYDIIHLLSPHPFYPIFKNKYVVTVHDFSYRRFCLNKTVKTFYELAHKSISYADAVIAVSSLTAEEARKYNKNVYVVNLGLDEKFFSPIPERKNRNLPFKFGYVGSLVPPRKNVLKGVEVFRRFKEDAVYELWGDYSPNSEIVKAVNGCKRIKLNGPFNENEIIKIYDSFDAFFFPSLEEGFGLPILEAQARGIPVIVFKNAKIPEEVCKYCIKIEDELPSINEIISFKEKYRKDMIEYARKFTWERTVEKTLEVYKKVV